MPKKERKFCRTGTLIYSRQLEETSPASEEYRAQIEELSFAQVWEQRQDLLNKLFKHIDGCLDRQLDIFRKEHVIPPPELPERSLLPQIVGYHLQRLFSFMIMPIAMYALSQSRDYGNRFKGAQHGCHSMKFFSSHSSLSPQLSEDLLLGSSFSNLAGQFARNASILMYNYAAEQYQNLRFAYRFLHYTDYTPQYFIANCSFDDAANGYKDLRVLIDDFFIDLISCFVYLQALQEADVFPYLVYEVGDNCGKKIHRQWQNVILPVTDSHWDALLPGNQPACDCHIHQLSEPEALAYPNRQELPEAAYRHWVKFGILRTFESGSFIPSPIKRYSGGE